MSISTGSDLRTRSQHGWTAPDPCADSHLDMLTRVACEALLMPMAMVNLFDGDRLAVGSAFGLGARETDLQDPPFCRHVMRSDQKPLIVSDAWADPHYATSALAAGCLGVRFQAGTAITDATGQTLGTLCVFDTRPRHLDEHAIGILLDLAATVAARLDFHQVKAAFEESELHYRHALELNPQMPWTASADGIVDEASPRWRAVMGEPADKATPLGRWASGFHPNETIDVMAAWWKSVKDGTPYDIQCRLRTGGAIYRWFRIRAAARRDDDGHIVRWYGTTEDIHDQKTTDLALAESEQRLRFALENAKLGTWDLDLASGHLKSSPLFAACFGFERVDEETGHQQLLSMLHPSDGAVRRDAIEGALARHEDLYVEYRIIWADGSTHWVRITGHGIYDRAGKPTRMTGLALDITDQRRDEEDRALAEARIRYLAYHDPLTGLANRRLLHDRLNESVSDAHEQSRLALLCIDIDQFRAINDTLGHDAGDRLLLHAADRLRACAGPKDIVARYGGDEFAFLVTDARNDADMDRLVIRIQQALAKPFEVEQHTVLLTGSIGIAFSPDHAGDAEQLLRNADAALYRAKLSGRGSSRVFEAGMDTVMQARQALKLRLRDALTKNQFRLFYQPLVDVATGRVDSFEALLRWQHPERGLLAPSEFIPAAEETGWIVAIGRWALQEACREAMKWPSTIGVAVNLSAIQFRFATLTADVIGALEQSGLPPNRLELEVTETLLIQDNDTNTSILESLSELGVRIALDDFGTGYSSLSYLRSFRFDKIKIDRSLITTLTEPPDSDAVMNAIVGLGRNLAIATTAEGIETDEQFALVRAYGCTQAQGFLFSEPVPASGVSGLLERLGSR
ncbi:EAL domain-containing protein [Lichenicola cladoniae]|uniref:EAL domain-containing protein n=1 Tax=Lichenicola cladoniae TaxID=1484109 RepID=A0A6M8HSS7_9PROT|nr:EAL domain-containing protein [Lichenicola cladoniae]NPD65556.1 EAL domain-containing protein [Acetobacteraceae bacterium]QKE91400.1 EAL domain-containing protein [Lichenicola cladoniae]